MGEFSNMPFGIFGAERVKQVAISNEKLQVLRLGKSHDTNYRNYIFSLYFQHIHWKKIIGTLS